MAKEKKSTTNETGAETTTKKRTRRAISFRLEYTPVGSDERKAAFFNNRTIVVDSIRDAKLVRDILVKTDVIDDAEKWFTVQIIESPSKESSLD